MCPILEGVWRLIVAGFLLFSLALRVCVCVKVLCLGEGSKPPKHNTTEPLLLALPLACALLKVCYL